MHITHECLQETSLELLAANYYEALRGKHFPLHQHLTYELTYYLRGHVEVDLDGRTYYAFPGFVTITPPKGAHAERAVTPYANYYVIFQASAPLPWPSVLVDSPAGDLHQLCRALCQEVHRQDAYCTEMQQLLLRQLDIVLRRSRERTLLPAEERLVRDAEQIIASRFSEAITIEQVARELGVHPATLRHYFARQRGKSPGQYLQEVRVQYALQIIAQSDLPLEAIAIMAGYCSASHLSRQIKKITGRRPGEFRRTSLLLECKSRHLGPSNNPLCD